MVTKFFMKFIKFLSALAVLLAAVAAGLFWLPTGSNVLLPLARYFGGNMTPSVLVGGIEGSLRQGYAVSDVKIISGDETYLTLGYAALSPDWDSILAGEPWLKSLELEGFSSDLSAIQALTEHFSGGDDTTEEEDDSDSGLPFTLKIKPVKISIRDVRFAVSQDLKLNLASLLMDENGAVSLRAHVNGLPLNADAGMGFEPLEILSSDITLGKGRASLRGRLEAPFEFRGDLVALPIETLLSFVPDNSIQAEGRLDGRFSLQAPTLDIADLTASGVVSVPRSVVMDVPLSLRVPWSWDKGLLVLEDANLKTRMAAMNLNASADLSRGFETARVTARGGVHNLSLSEAGRLFAPDAGLAGEKGKASFNVTAGLDGNPETIAGEISVRLPEVIAAGKRIVQGLAVDARLVPGNAPGLSCSGEIFGGKLFGRGEAAYQDNTVKPRAVLSLVNLDLSALAAAFPAAASASPSGRVTLTMNIDEALSVIGRLTSDRLSASGVTARGLVSNFNYKNKNSSVTGDLSLGQVTASGVTVQDIEAALRYRDGRAVLDSLTGRLGKAPISVSGTADVNAQTLDFRAGIKNLDPRSVPQLKDAQVRALCNLDAVVGGTFSMPDVKLRMKAGNVQAAGVPLGNLDVAVNYAKDQVVIPETRINLPGGTVTLKGDVALKGTDPKVSFNASTRALNLEKLSRALKLQDPVKGVVQGRVNVRGPLSSATVAANLRADGIKVSGIDVPYAILEADGNMKHISVNKLEAKVDGAVIKGSGWLVPGKKDLMDSAAHIGVSVRNLELRPFLSRFMDNPPVRGNLNGTLNLDGTPAKPSLTLNVNSPVSVSQITLDSMRLKVTSPAKEHYALNAGLRTGEFNLNLDGDVLRKGKSWLYHFTTKPMDVGKLVEAGMPEAAGLVSGTATVDVKGSAPGDAPVNIQVSSSRLAALDKKIIVKDISLPVTVMPASNKIQMKQGRATLSGGLIRSNLDVDLAKSNWKGSVNVKGLDFGRLAGPFMPEGELVGFANANVEMKGDYGGAFATSFARGNFSTGPGYLHKMELLDRISPTRRISFEDIRGTFFWDGSDLFLNPGSQVTAGAGEPLYRYFSINGSAGIPGKGLKLLCQGRFDLKMLDQLLGAMKGIFQYTTGSLTRDVLRDAAGRILGVKRRDFQNVSFTLANSWQELRLLDLKIDKPIQDFLPIDMLNGTEEQKKDDRQFKLQLKIPTGPGNESVEDESAADQFKEQLIDNLFNIGS